ncbi:uncharacterized protein LOC127718914 isoform X1 [Mytilus californianus]|uniref:uncharacterized protein LOC127718914 isoform X1 n=1 Tax=Mytilus californianus TaxID=6549 RepID=UPI0022460D6E|nr:uncharacterized protein LOC127718914 isoform X1 [Mytilus californianus]
MSTSSLKHFPDIEADPYNGAHYLRWSKTARSLPSGSKSRLTTSYSRELSLLDDDVTTNIPYRLPRISHRDDFKSEDDDDKIFSRFGYEPSLRVPELVPVVRMLNPPQTYSQQERQVNLAVPKFQNAAITPTVRQLQWHPVKDSNMEDVQVYKSMIGNQRQRSNGDYFRPEPSPSPISRTDSPTKSIKSIHWMLGSAKHPMFDNKGRTRNQGPFSREFTVTCIAPTNWMKMKWGRSRTIIH